MNWEQIRDLYAKACGQSTDSFNERWDHINFAYRHLCGVLELAELRQVNAVATTVGEQDWIDIDCDLYNVEFMVMKATGRKLDHEEGGMRGRSRFFEVGESRPNLGKPQFWVRAGNRIWLRPTPDAVYDLLITFRFLPALVSDADLASHPITPPQFDWSIVRLAVANYFNIHPPVLPDGMIDYGRADRFKTQAAADIAELRAPIAKEQEDRRDFLRQGGYDFNVR